MYPWENHSANCFPSRSSRKAQILTVSVSVAQPAFPLAVVEARRHRLMTTRTWVSPAGDVYDVSDDNLYVFCISNGLHYSNMVTHTAKDNSDQANFGWRLIERLRAIGHVDRLDQHVLALGTIESFSEDCLNSKDGRDVLKDRKTLGKLLRNAYNGGRPWNKWECRELSTQEKRRLLSEQSGLNHNHVHGTVAASSSSRIGLPDYTNALGTPCGDSAPTLHVEDDSSATIGSYQVSFGGLIACSSLRVRWYRKPSAIPRNLSPKRSLRVCAMILRLRMPWSRCALKGRSRRQF